MGTAREDLSLQHEVHDLRETMVVKFELQKRPRKFLPKPVAPVLLLGKPRPRHGIYESQSFFLVAAIRTTTSPCGCVVPLARLPS